MIPKHSTNLPSIDVLTGLRFFAAFFVLLAHGLPKVIPVSAGVAPGLYVFATSLWGIGMTLFFVLSGFVIHYNYSQVIRKNPFIGVYNFLIARFARLYPLFFIGLLLDLTHRYGYSMLQPHFKQSLLYYVTLTHSWIYIVFNSNALIYQFGHLPQVAWSISTEWFFYLCYPFILLLLLKTRTIHSKILTMLMFCVLAFIGIILLKHNQMHINAWAISNYGPIADMTTSYQDCFYRWLVYFSPYTRLVEFILGCFTASIYMSLIKNEVSTSEKKIGLVVLTTTIFFSIYLTKIFYARSVLPYSYFKLLSEFFGYDIPVAIIIFCCARYPNYLTRLLSKPVLLLLGNCSYSIYLFHLYIIEAFSRDAAQVSNFSIFVADGSRFLIAVTAIFGLSIVTYNIIEVPARRYLRKKLTYSIKDTPHFKDVGSMEGVYNER